MKTSLAIASSLLAALAADAAALDRQDLEKKLQELAKSTPPTKLVPGAMCYDRALQLERMEYTCPVCQEKTLYPAEGTFAVQEQLRQADTYRRLVKQLQDKGLTCKLDETAFCQKCSKGQDPKAFALVVQWPSQEKPDRTELRTPNDLELILEFLEGKKVHQGIPGDGLGETPLKSHLPRLRTLLGLEEPKKPEEKKP